MQMIEIQVFEVCVVVGYASYSDCNEISQVQLYLKMLRLKHSVGEPRVLGYITRGQRPVGLSADSRGGSRSATSTHRRVEWG